MDDKEVEDKTYWSHLGSIGIQAVRVEGEKIRSEKNSVAAGTRSLAFDHYRTFIATSDCGKDAAVHLKASHEHTEKLGEKLTPLRDACMEFESHAKTLASRRKSTSLVLARHTKLLEVLELPQLVEICVRNGEFDEALELTQYASRLEKKLGSIPIVVELVKAIKQTSKVMLNQLLLQLRAPIQLPSCLKVVGYLRRMDAFGETELRLRFLQARDAWLTSILKTVPKDDPYEHLTKTLELTRVHLFDIVTQYRALFSDDDPLAYNPGGNPQASHRLMFSAWLNSKLNQFLLVLKQDLDAGAKKQSLDSIISQAMYFGQSFGRVGADFRLSLVPILTQAVLDVALEHLEGAEQRFKQGIDQLALKSITLSKNSENNDKTEDLQPPLDLLEFPPLAEVCNAVLSSLNEMRLCSIISLAPELIKRIESVLTSCAQTLKDREARFGKSSIETEKATFQQLVEMFALKLLPYLDRCLRAIFPPQQQSAITSDAKFTLNLEVIHDAMPMKDLVLNKPKPYVELPTVEDVQVEVPYVVDRVSVISQEIEATEKPNTDVVEE